MKPKRLRDSTKAKPFLVHFRPKSASQKAMLAAYPNADILFLLGPAGVGKSHAAVASACLDLTANSNKKLLFLRPTVEAGRSIGFLPGTLDEKIDPYFGAFKQILKKVALHLPEDRLCFEALGFQRGVTYENCVAILDEAQNADFRQLKMLLTRLGANAKLLILGDAEQSDLRPTVPDYDCDLLAVVDALEGLERVAIIDFDPSESLRRPLITKILHRLHDFRG